MAINFDREPPVQTCAQNSPLGRRRLPEVSNGVVDDGGHLGLHFFGEDGVEK